MRPSLCVSCNDLHPLQALYHEKPIVAMPFFADQLPNAEKVVAKVSNTPRTLPVVCQHCVED